jgi:CelD/BcsL family acetyltransferase involved in cellulose biosynthesis
MKIEIINETQALRALEPEWNDLCTRVPDHRYNQTFSWLWRGWECVLSKKNYDLHVIVGRTDGRVVLIWPVVVHRYLAWRMLGWLGADSTECPDLLVESGPKTLEWLQAAWKIIVYDSGIDVIDFRYVREDSPIAPLLEGSANAHKKYSRAPYVACDSWTNWASYFKSLSRKFRNDQMRQRRRLSKCGGVSFEIAETTVEVRDSLRWLLIQKTAFLDQMGVRKHWFQHRENLDFLQSVVMDSHSSGNLYLAKLCVDGTTIAVLLGFVFKGRLEAVVTTYDPAWQSYSPGRILMEECLKWSFEKQIKIFDFRMNVTPNKRNWAKTSVLLCGYLIPCSFLGRIYVAWFDSTAREGLKKFYWILPKRTQRVIRNVLQN